MRAPRDRHVGFPVLGAYPHPSKTQAAPGGGEADSDHNYYSPASAGYSLSAGACSRARPSGPRPHGHDSRLGQPPALERISRGRPYSEPEPALQGSRGRQRPAWGSSPPGGRDGQGRDAQPLVFPPDFASPSPEHPPGSPQRAAPGGFAAPPPCCRASSPPSSPRRPPGSFLSSPLAPPIVISVCPGSESSAAGCGSLPNRLPAAWAGVEGPGASGSILKQSVSVARRALL